MLRNHIWTLVSAVLAFHFISVSQAEDRCEPKDFSSQVGPVHAQETNRCYSYVAADMLTQKLRRMDPQKFADFEVSAMDVAFQFLWNTPSFVTWPDEGAGSSAHKVIKQQKKKLKDRISVIQTNPKMDNFQFGYSDLAIFSYPTQSLGFCSEKDLPSELGTTSAMTEAVNKVQQDHIEQCVRHNSQVRDLVAIRNQSWAEVIASKCKRVQAPFVPTIRRVETPYGYEEVWKKDGSLEFRSKENGKWVNRTNEMRNSLWEKLDEGLDHGSIVGVDISMAFLKLPHDQAWMIPGKARHAVSIVARKRINGQCSYLVRDTDNPACKTSNARFRKRCSKGQTWVTVSELLPNMFRAQYIE